MGASYSSSLFRPVAMLDGLMAAHMVAVIERDLTLAGFAGGATVNVYTHPERVG